MIPEINKEHGLTLLTGHGVIKEVYSNLHDLIRSKNSNAFVNQTKGLQKKILKNKMLIASYKFYKNVKNPYTIDLFKKECWKPTNYFFSQITGPKPFDLIAVRHSGDSDYLAHEQAVIFGLGDKFFLMSMGFAFDREIRSFPQSKLYNCELKIIETSLDELKFPIWNYILDVTTEGGQCSYILGESFDELKSSIEKFIEENPRGRLEINRDPLAHHILKLSDKGKPKSSSEARQLYSKSETCEEFEAEDTRQACLKLLMENSHFKNAVLVSDKLGYLQTKASIKEPKFINLGYVLDKARKEELVVDLKEKDQEFETRYYKKEIIWRLTKEIVNILTEENNKPSALPN